jgi:hypothetical protein
MVTMIVVGVDIGAHNINEKLHLVLLEWPTTCGLDIVQNNIKQNNHKMPSHLFIQR